MIDIVLAHVIPAAYSLLPSKMNSTEATAQVLACGLQESRFLNRRQLRNGPARGFWQFERGKLSALAGVLTHKQTTAYARHALGELRYVDLALVRVEEYREPAVLEAIQGILEHNDVLAAAFARLLLWTLPDKLPTREERDKAWSQYLEAWRPGEPHPETWPAMHSEAWGRILDVHTKEQHGNGGIGRNMVAEAGSPRPGDSRGHARPRHPQPAAQTRRYRTH